MRHACPVSVSEIIDQGVTGTVVDTMEEAIIEGLVEVPDSPGVGGLARGIAAGLHPHRDRAFDEARFGQMVLGW